MPYSCGRGRAYDCATEGFEPTRLPAAVHCQLVIVQARGGLRGTEHRLVAGYDWPEQRCALSFVPTDPPALTSVRLRACTAETRQVSRTPSGRAAGCRSVESITAYDSEATGTVNISQEDAWCASSSKVCVHAAAAMLGSTQAAREYTCIRMIPAYPVKCARAGLAFDAARDRQANLGGCSRA